MEYLSFRLGNEEYGIDIQKVQELRGYTPVTRLVTAPGYIKGVVNLRGLIVPIIDLRIKLGLATTYTELTVVIILSFGGNLTGIVVDSVSDVVALGGDQVNPVPEVGSRFDADYLVGVGSLDERMILLMDIERLLASNDLTLIEQQAA
jgi:purine-binding chemotaxis protein CheW